MPEKKVPNNELTLFDDILYGSLAPWLDKNKPDERFVAKLNEIKKVEPFFPYQYEIEFYRPFNAKTQYYHKLIQNESIAYCNKIFQIVKDDDNIKLLKYWRNDTLEKKIPSKLKDLGKLIKDKQYDLHYIDPKKMSFDVDADHKTEAFVMQLLKVAFIRIFLETQDFFPFIPNEELFIEEDLYTRFLFEPVPKISFLKKVPLPINITSHSITTKKLNFGYKEKTTDRLKDICRLLNLKIDFLNDDLTSEDNFVEVMTSKDLNKISTQIHIGCETTQFRYIVDKFKPYFNSLTLSNIEKSKLFYSKNGVLITATNLSRNKHHDPKEKTTIDKIFK